METLSRSMEDYLKALHALSPAGERVATSHLAGRLRVSAPSVTVMLGRLAEARLVTYAPRAGARLTPAGRRRALDMLRRHRILEAFLAGVLRLDWADVHEEAEVLEHHISPRVLDAIDRLLGHPGEDPHGHPIPDRRGRIRRRALRPLAGLAEGARATVREVRAEGDRDRMARFKAVGLVPGARVTMRAARDGDDVFDLEVEGRRFTSGGRGLEGIWVEPGRDDASGA